LTNTTIEFNASSSYLIFEWHLQNLSKLQTARAANLPGPQQLNQANFQTYFDVANHTFDVTATYSNGGFPGDERWTARLQDESTRNGTILLVNESEAKNALAVKVPISYLSFKNFTVLPLESITFLRYSDDLYLTDFSKAPATACILAASPPTSSSLPTKIYSKASGNDWTVFLALPLALAVRRLHHAKQ